LKIARKRDNIFSELELGHALLYYIYCYNHIYYYVIFTIIMTTGNIIIIYLIDFLRHSILVNMLGQNLVYYAQVDIER